MATIRAAIDRNRSQRQSTGGALPRQLPAATTAVAPPSVRTALDFVEELCEDMPGIRCQVVSRGN